MWEDYQSPRPSQKIFGALRKERRSVDADAVEKGISRHVRREDFLHEIIWSVGPLKRRITNWASVTCRRRALVLDHVLLKKEIDTVCLRT